MEISNLDFDHTDSWSPAPPTLYILIEAIIGNLNSLSKRAGEIRGRLPSGNRWNETDGNQQKAKL